jgi:hypothetical protein
MSLRPLATAKTDAEYRTGWPVITRIAAGMCRRVSRRAAGERIHFRNDAHKLSSRCIVDGFEAAQMAAKFHHGDLFAAEGDDLARASNAVVLQYLKAGSHFELIPGRAHIASSVDFAYLSKVDFLISHLSDFTQSLEILWLRHLDTARVLDRAEETKTESPQLRGKLTLPWSVASLKLFPRKRGDDCWR